MIGVISQEYLDITTELVMDWIECLGGVSVRINGEDFNAGTPFSLSLGPDGTNLAVEVGNMRLLSRDSPTVWFRRWHTLSNLGIRNILGASDLTQRLESHLSSELRALLGSLPACLADGSHWLSNPISSGVNKIHVLDVARRSGLPIPRTIITNQKSEAEAFIKEVGQAIVKPIGNALSIYYQGNDYVTYTATVSSDTTKHLSPHFFPSLIQERIDKLFEMRIFYINGTFYSMAIFSQSDPKTSIDFRNYNHTKPNRCVPYTLNEETEGRLRDVLSTLNLDTCSIDMIRTPRKQNVFLEVNPVGQFGMISHPCNYRLEKIVAEHLIKEDVSSGQRREGLP